MDRDNSKELPATFIMKLTKPLPIAANLLKEIHSVVTGILLFSFTEFICQIAYEMHPHFKMDWEA